MRKCAEYRGSLFSLDTNNTNSLNSYFYKLALKLALTMKSNIELGRFGEQLATEFLRKERYEILYNNYRSGHYEIDIIVRDAFTLRFVEVKTRHHFAKSSIELSLNPKKMDSLKRGIFAFLSTHHDLNRLEIFQDLITVTVMDDGTHTLEYIPDYMRF